MTKQNRSQHRFVFCPCSGVQSMRPVGVQDMFFIVRTVIEFLTTEPGYIGRELWPKLTSECDCTFPQVRFLSSRWLCLTQAIINVTVQKHMEDTGNNTRINKEILSEKIMHIDVYIVYQLRVLY